MTLKFLRLPHTSRRGVIWILLFLIFIAIAVVLLIQFLKPETKNIDRTDQNPTFSAYLNAEINQANENIDKQNYDEAISLLIVAMNDSLNSGEHEKLKSAVESAFTKIPDDKISYRLYSAYAGFLAEIGEKDKAKELLDKAILAAEKPGSTVDPDTIIGLKNRREILNQNKSSVDSE